MNSEQRIPDSGEVEYPAMRHEIRGVLEALSDLDYQETVWVGKNFPNTSYYDDFDMAIHTLYDDIGLGDDVHSQIGSTLRNETEAWFVREVISALEEVFAEAGLDSTFDVIRNSSGWPRVVNAAAAALAEFRKPLR